MKYHALFVVFEKTAKFEIVVCGALWIKVQNVIKYAKCQTKSSVGRALDWDGMISS